MTEEPADVDLHLSVESGPPGREALTFRVTPAYEDDLRAALHEAGFTTSDMVELSVVTEVMVAFGVFVQAGGFEQLGVILDAFLRRNRDKKVTFDANGNPIEIEGMGASEVGKTLRIAKEIRDEQWRQQLRGRDTDR